MGEPAVALVNLVVCGVSARAWDQQSRRPQRGGGGREGGEATRSAARCHVFSADECPPGTPLPLSPSHCAEASTPNPNACLSVSDLGIWPNCEYTHGAC